MHRKDRIILIILVFLVSIIQSTFLHNLRIFNIKPDILLCLVIFAAFYGGASFGFKTGIFAGVMKDILSGGVFGLNILSFSLVGLILGFYSIRLYREKITSQIIICFIATFLIGNLSYIITDISYSQPAYPLSLRMVIIPLALYTTLAYYFIWLLLSNTLNTN